MKKERNEEVRTVLVGSFDGSRKNYRNHPKELMIEKIIKRIIKGKTRK